MRVLQIIECAYRATIEEQQDTILWLCQSLLTTAGEISLLLRGNAVNYAVLNLNVPAMQVGAWSQHRPGDPGRQLRTLIDCGVQIHVLAEDARDRGLIDMDLHEAVNLIPLREVPDLMDRHDQIWHW